MPDNIVFATNTHDHVSELTLILVFCSVYFDVFPEKPVLLIFLIAFIAARIIVT
jgi:hypothetical protein